MKTVTKEDACRSEHLPHCAGYEDCICFGEYVTYAEMWDQQQHIAALQDECERLRLRIAKLRMFMRSTVVEMQVASARQDGDIATKYDLAT